MRQIHEQQYSRFTPKERLNLTFAALSRDDEAEANRLWETCPKHTYEAHDFEYTLGVDAAILLSAVFFEKCVYHYNLIKRAETHIICSEHELEFEESENLVDLTKKTKSLIEIISKAKNLHISRIKGLFEGFRQFCSDAGLNNENIIATLPIKGCCYDLDILLNDETEIDQEYLTQYKELFLKHWNF